MKLALLNSAIIAADGMFRIKSIDLETAIELTQSNGLLSAIGHESTAQIITELLGTNIKANMIQFCQEVGQNALIFKLKGRAPEVVILSKEEIENIGYEFKLITREE